METHLLQEINDTITFFFHPDKTMLDHQQHIYIYKAIYMLFQSALFKVFAKLVCTHKEEYLSMPYCYCILKWLIALWIFLCTFPPKLQLLFPIVSRIQRGRINNSICCCYFTIKIRCIIYRVHVSERAFKCYWGHAKPSCWVFCTVSAWICSVTNKYMLIS